MGLFGKNKEKRFTRVFFATDVHGSERTFRKFLNAGKYYEADIVMLCGDLTGKMVVPITESPDGTYVCRLFGQDHKASTKDELASLEEKVSDTGFYPYQTNQKEVAELRADSAKIDGIFKRLMLERLQRWVKMVEEHYKNTGIKCIMTGGNDDPNEIEQILNSSSVVVNPEGQLIKLNEHHEMITVSHANLTPWKCPRDVSEEILKDMISNLAGKVEKMESCIFNLHAPPKDSRIDTAQKLDGSVYPPKVITQGGQAVVEGVGSTAVRESIEKYQPLLGLHGHIHESRGAVKIGRTLCINPGSEYSEGVLRGAIANIAETKVLGYQLTSG